MRIKIVAVSVILILGIASGIYAQNAVKSSEDYQRNLRVYARSMKYNDAEAATNALYNLVVMQPRNDTLLISLARLYFDAQKFIPSILVANDVLSINPDNIAALEISAIAKENIGATEKALEDFESLYLKTEDLNTLYKIGFLQYELQKFTEAATTSDILLAKDTVKQIQLYFPKEDQSQQEVSMEASLYNLKGLINKEKGEKEKAEENFEKALELEPDFFLAQKNMEALKEEE